LKKTRSESILRFVSASYSVGRWALLAWVGGANCSSEGYASFAGQSPGCGCRARGGRGSSYL